VEEVTSISTYDYLKPEEESRTYEWAQS